MDIQFLNRLLNLGCFPETFHLVSADPFRHRRAVEGGGHIRYPFLFSHLLEPRIDEIRSSSAGCFRGLAKIVIHVALGEDVVMTTEDITNMGMVGWLDQISSPVTLQERQQPSVNDLLGDTPDAELMFVPSPQPIWPRVWPGL